MSVSSSSLHQLAKVAGEQPEKLWMAASTAQPDPRSDSRALRPALPSASHSALAPARLMVPLGSLRAGTGTGHTHTRRDHDVTQAAGPHQ